MSVQRCQQETTSTEFTDWMMWLRDEPNHFHRQDHYWAQIAYEIAKSTARKPKEFVKKYSVKDFLIQFTTKRKKEKVIEEQDQEERLKRSKGHWGSVLGSARDRMLKKNKQKKKK